MGGSVMAHECASIFQAEGEENTTQVCSAILHKSLILSSLLLILFYYWFSHKATASSMHLLLKMDITRP